METLKLEPWVREAARQPVAFAQVREDPTMDLALLERLGSGLRVVMIASGGCTAASLIASGRTSHVHLIDANPAQIAMARSKLALLLEASFEQRMRLLGHTRQDPDQRRRDGLSLLCSLQLPPDIFGEVEVWSKLGLDQCGRYELLFAELRRQLAEQPSTRDEAFRRVMSQENLVALFGPGATANRAKDFWQHFLCQTERALAIDPSMSGPFLSQMLRGCFASRPHHWLALAPPARWPVVTWEVHAALPALRRLEAKSCDFLHLSNILDWVPIEEARQTLEQAARILRPGGLMALRQLNSTLPVRRLGERVKWHESLSDSLLARDASFFYREFHVGCVP